MVAFVVLTSFGCGETEQPTPEDRPATSAPETLSSEEPRGPQGAGSASCDGASVDPDGPIAMWMQRASTGDLTGAIEGMEGLVGANPSSATARVRLGELLLRTQPPAAERAERWFDTGLALHQRGCALADQPLWLAYEGASLSRMMQGNYRGALPFLRRSLDRWPAARSTRYNLACALCQTDDIEGCARELRRAVRSDEPLPPFLDGATRSGGDLAHSALSDPDLAPLRADEARFEAALQAD